MHQQKSGITPIPISFLCFPCVLRIKPPYQDNDKVRTARDRYIELGAEAGFEIAPITWSRRQKGIDDLYKHLFRSK